MACGDGTVTCSPALPLSNNANQTTKTGAISFQVSIGGIPKQATVIVDELTGATDHVDDQDARIFHFMVKTPDPMETTSVQVYKAVFKDAPTFRCFYTQLVKPLALNPLPPAPPSASAPAGKDLHWLERLVSTVSDSLDNDTKPKAEGLVATPCFVMLTSEANRKVVSLTGGIVYHLHGAGIEQAFRAAEQRLAPSRALLARIGELEARVHALEAALSSRHAE